MRRQAQSHAATGDVGFRAAAPILRRQQQPGLVEGSRQGRTAAAWRAAASSVATAGRAASAFERCLQQQVARPRGTATPTRTHEAHATRTRETSKPTQPTQRSKPTLKTNAFSYSTPRAGHSSFFFQNPAPHYCSRECVCVFSVGVPKPFRYIPPPPKNTPTRERRTPDARQRLLADARARRSNPPCIARHAPRLEKPLGFAPRRPPAPRRSGCAQTYRHGRGC